MVGFVCLKLRNHARVLINFGKTKVVLRSALLGDSPFTSRCVINPDKGDNYAVKKNQVQSWGWGNLASFTACLPTKQNIDAALGEVFCLGQKQATCQPISID